MQCVENSPVIGLVPNTAAQNEELSRRTIVLEGTKHPMLDAVSILCRAVDVADEAPNTAGGRTVIHRALQAPYGRYRPLAAGDTKLVAVHVHESGRVEAYGPFESDEEAYDYFPDHSSPHDTWVAVFAVPVDTP